MAFDGIITAAQTKELKDILLLGRIDKIYQPVKEELVFNIHTKDYGNVRLFASASSSSPRLHLIDFNPVNPPVPSGFCMLMRKHLQGGRITDIKQKDSERIIEISVETLNEMGFSVGRKVIFEIMGKHSNIILVDLNGNKVLDSIKRVSIDTSRVRPILPGMVYNYPPSQDKIPFKEITSEQVAKIPKTRKAMLSSIGGISPAIADEMANSENPYEFLRAVVNSIEDKSFHPHIYLNELGNPVEYHIAELSAYEGVSKKNYFDTLSQCLHVFFENRDQTNRIKQRSHQLTKTLSNLLDKSYLKLQKLQNDKMKAQDSEHLRLFGELLTANLHDVKPGSESVELINYYNGETIKIPLDSKYSPAINAQKYYKQYGKAKTAVKEKEIQIQETQKDIDYLESVLNFLENAERPEDIEYIRTELMDTGYLRKRKDKIKPRKFKSQPFSYETSTGKKVLAGRNNKENDELTQKKASKNDLWFHTKDIPGSHVILFLDGAEPEETDIIETAAIAAWHSKGKNSENVPVDYVKVRHVKKPNGAKPGMVIFTDNKTIWVDPAIPKNEKN